MNDKSHAAASLCDHCDCTSYRPRTQPDPVKYVWPKCVCGHTRQDHNETANGTPDQSNAGADNGNAGALTLDHTSELFRTDPTPHTAKTYLAVATEYARDGMIGPDELKHIKAMLEPIVAQAVPLHAEIVGERLKRLYPEHYVTIITEMNRQNGPEWTVKELGMASDPRAGYGGLAGVFIWERSVAGYEFWAKLAERERS